MLVMQQHNKDMVLLAQRCQTAAACRILLPVARSFCFKDQYIELTTAVPADADLYGLGEVSLPTGMLLPRNGTIITLWARDIGSNTAWANLYGAHPFFLQVNACKVFN
jgi:alpha-glucosidase (family GH31 glycosyl hydrolase)